MAPTIVPEAFAGLVVNEQSRYHGSSFIESAIRAIRGQSDLNTIMHVLDRRDLALVLAFAPNASPEANAIAALFTGLTDLLDARVVANSDISTAVAQIIGTSIGSAVLQSWAEIAPAGRGRMHAAALIDAVNTDTCDASVAAALIGPCDESAALLRSAQDVAFAIRRWGQSTPNEPTEWTDKLSVRERDRRIKAVQRSPSAIASCIPWIPPDMTLRKNITFEIRHALEAFAQASPTARAMHTLFLQRLVEKASATGSLTRLACVMQSKEVWDRVKMLVWRFPDSAHYVVTAAPWDDIDKDVQNVILQLTKCSNACAAVAAARGRGAPKVMDLASSTTVSFFAALDPNVWDSLDPAIQREWRSTAGGFDIHFAVRSLGLRPEFLVDAAITNNLVRAAQRHACNAALRCALFPAAMRRITPKSAHALIAALPTLPSNPSAFFCIASGSGNPAVIPSASDRLRTPDDLAFAVLLQRFKSDGYDVRSSWTMLYQAFQRRTDDNLASMMALLPETIRTALMINEDALVERLAHPNRHQALRTTLARMTAIPLANARIVRLALEALRVLSEYEWRIDARREASEAIASALHAYGDLFVALADALPPGVSAALLPLPKRKPLADALRNFARDDPPSALRMAYALHESSPSDAIRALLASPSLHAATIWRTLHPSTRSAIAQTLTTANITAAYDAISTVMQHDPLGALALAAALHENNGDLQNAGIAALSKRPNILRAAWDRLPQEAQQSLQQHPSIAFAVADIPDVATPSSAHRSRIRR